jgi:oxygen-independent coproporphyrinogen III oxidase
VAQRNKTLQRNFQGYSTKGGADIYAFGMSAISQADGVYWQNFKEVPRYFAAIDANEAPLAKAYILSADDKIRRHTIMRLMCDLSLDYAAMSQTLGIDFTTYFAPELESLKDLEEDRLLTRDGNGLTVTNQGRLFIRNIAMRFDRYLPALKERRFSKTI